ncbi:hypothetical protein SAY86_023566 [Trapa natans]|uniref:Uncharacterized protein n=1 Tax=Trapa natans TaxID=22666 RepID=A0AAN7MAM8_TRANT|nr:hypothetical protein SAY86_023566 [Trapa natans]
MGGGMEAHKNRFIEDWSTARENLEHNFRWTRRNLALVGIFGIAIPVLVYKGIVREFTEKEFINRIDCEQQNVWMELGKSTFLLGQ